MSSDEILKGGSNKYKYSPIIKLNTFQLLNSKLSKKYSHDEKNYNDNLIECLIYNKNSHYASVFRDCMLYDYIDEYLKRFYHRSEAMKKVPKLSKYYTNYLSFFLRPVFRDFFVNSELKIYGENKAELYYYCQYGKKANQGEESMVNNVQNVDSYCKDQVNTLLTDDVRKKIDKNSMNHTKCEDLSSVYYAEIKSGMNTLRDQQESIIHILSGFEAQEKIHLIQNGSSPENIIPNGNENKIEIKSIEITNLNSVEFKTLPVNYPLSISNSKEKNLADKVKIGRAHV